MCVLPQPGALFLTSQLPKVLQTWCVLYVLTSKCASRHRREHFLNCSTSKNAFRTSGIFRILTSQCASGTVARIFALPAPAALASLLLFGPPEPQNSGKTKSFATVSRTSIFFPHALFSASSHNCGYFFQSACTTLYCIYINRLCPHCLWLLEPPWHSHTRHRATQKNRKIRKSSGFLMRYNEKTGQYIPEALWHLVTKADPSCLDRHIMARPWIVHPCSFLIVL